MLLFWQEYLSSLNHLCFCIFIYACVFLFVYLCILINLCVFVHLWLFVLVYLNYNIFDMISVSTPSSRSSSSGFCVNGPICQASTQTRREEMLLTRAIIICKMSLLLHTFEKKDNLFPTDDFDMIKSSSLLYKMLAVLWILSLFYTLWYWISKS